VLIGTTRTRGDDRQAASLHWPQQHQRFFDELTPDQGAALAGAYWHLGDAFEDRCDDEMLGLGFHLEDPWGLLQYKSDKAARARPGCLLLPAHA